jgi:tetratricopeptide (TPR) repeat protein
MNQGKNMYDFKKSKKQFLWLACVMAGAVVFASLGFWSCKKPELDQSVENVEKAYELRVNGKADEAKTLLEQILSENPDDALAHYELARTKYQLTLADPKEFITIIENILNSLGQAMKIDPENVIYPFFAARVAFMKAYIAMQRNQPDVKDRVAKLCSLYESALELKPDYREAMLYLVEAYGVLPEDKGGDKVKAEQYAMQLEELDKVFGAKARAILMPEEADYIGYWKKILEEHEGNADVLTELGRAYLFRGNTEEGVKLYKEAVRIAPGKIILILDLARYHGMTVMKDEKLMETALPLAGEMYQRYIDSEPIPPLKAFATRHLAMVRRGLGDEEETKKLLEEADTIDPNYSRAFGVPTPDLWIPPGQISHNHRSLFRPF